MRLEWSPDDVRVQDGAHQQKKPFLRVRPRVQRHHRNETEGQNPRPALQTGQQGRPQHQEHQRMVLMMGRATVRIADIPCGNPVALVGVDQFLIKFGSVTSIDDAHNIADISCNVSPVLKVAVRPKDGRDLPKLVEGLKKLSMLDPLVAPPRRVEST